VTDGLRIDLVGWRGTRGRFVAATSAAKQQMADALEQQGAALVHLAQAESPHGRHPFGTEPGSVHFAAAWRSTFSATETGGTTTLENVSPHAEYVLFPTRPHPIVAADRPSATDPGHEHVLRFAGRGGEVVFRHDVQHPGTPGNPVHERTWQAAQAGVLAALGKVATTVDAQIAAAWSPAESEA